MRANTAGIGAAWVMAGALAALGSAVMAAGERHVSLDVQFRLTDLDYKPLAGVPVRLAFGDVTGAAPFHSVVTGADGQANLTIDTIVDQRQKKLPTNFVDSLLSRPKTTDHLTIGAELPYMSYRWLYVVDLYRFPDGGDVVTDGVTLYARGPGGRYTEKAVMKDGGWEIADLKPRRLTTLGYDVWNFMLQPKPGAATAWTLALAFKRFPDPVVR